MDMVGSNYSYIKEMKEYALAENVPIIQEDGLSFLTNFIMKNNIKKILEIGTAIGYSAIMMAITCPNVSIVTIEKDEKRYLEAVKNVKKLKLEDRITLIFKDALEVKLEQEYDLIFIDAAKSQSTRFFLNFEKNLTSRGYIITDNMNFHGYVSKKEEEIKSKNLRALVRKIRDYQELLKSNEKYETTFYDTGDGISVSRKKK